MKDVPDCSAFVGMVVVMVVVIVGGGGWGTELTIAISGCLSEGVRGRG
jgi:hypothetical protein